MKEKIGREKEKNGEGRKGWARKKRRRKREDSEERERNKKKIYIRPPPTLNFQAMALLIFNAINASFYICIYKLTFPYLKILYNPK